jgi:hypothetical protein
VENKLFAVDLIGFEAFSFTVPRTCEPLKLRSATLFEEKEIAKKTVGYSLRICFAADIEIRDKRSGVKGYGNNTSSSLGC